MAQAKIVKELNITTANKVGMMADVSGVISDSGVNINAICAYGMQDKAVFMMVTSDNNKAKDALTKKGFKVEEKEVVAVSLPDKVGQAKEISSKIKNAGINLDYIYGSNCGCADTQALMIIGSKDNVKVISAINN